MAIEELLCADFIMNLSIFFAVQAGLGRIHPPSLLRALTAAALNTMTVHIFRVRFWRSLPVQAMMCMLFAAILIRERRILPIVTASAAIFCATAAAAGFASLNTSLPYAALLLLFLLLIRRRRHPMVQWQVEIIAEKDGVRDCFRALIDTGNRLTEHRSALPVLIAERRAIPHLAKHMDSIRPAEVRTLSFGVLGSGGEMRCFLPDSLLLLSDGSARKAPNCWIAVFDGSIPGFTQALAPPEFAEYACVHNVPQGALTDTIRRFSHAFFHR